MFSAGISSLRSHVRISSASVGRQSPNDSVKSAATASASASVAGLSSDELIERLRQREQVRQLARRLRLRRLAEPVDPHAHEAELVARSNVVKARRGDVHMALARRTRAVEELRPVLVARLVRADL